MPNINKETVYLMRQRCTKVFKRLTLLSARMERIATRLNDEGATMPAEKYNKLLSEYRILERSFDAAKEEHRVLLLF